MVDKRHVPARQARLKPITLPGGFTFTSTGVMVRGRPSIAEYSAALAWAHHAEKASQWWVADLLAYAEKRADWEQLRDGVIEATGYSLETVRKYKFVGEKIEPGRRLPEVDFSVHAAVANLPAKDQDKLLERAATESLSVRDVRLEVKAVSRRQVIDGEAVLAGMFRVVYADFPWQYQHAQPSGVDPTAHYKTMTVEDGCKLPVREHVTRNAVLFFWCPAPKIFEGAKELIEAWGFTYKTNIVWDKVVHNFGHYVSVRHEHLLIATRGSCTPENPLPMPDSVQTIRRTGEHSEKPEEFRQLIEKLYPTGPHLELFGRKPVDGWTVFGNDARLWAKESEGA